MADTAPPTGRAGPRSVRAGPRADLAEFTGVTFSPGARTIYVDAYTPGATFAVTGPWNHWAAPPCAAAPDVG